MGSVEDCESFVQMFQELTKEEGRGKFKFTEFQL